MSENRYAPPQAVIADREVVPEVPAEVLKQIKSRIRVTSCRTGSVPSQI